MDFLIFISVAVVLLLPERPLSEPQVCLPPVVEEEGGEGEGGAKEEAG